MKDMSRLDEDTVNAVQELIRTNLVSRDSLYAAAENLDNQSLQNICRHFADRLGGHVAVLQQFLLTHHLRPVGPEDAAFVKLLDIQLDELRQSSEEWKALEATEKCTHHLKQQYEEAIASTDHYQARGLFYQQRKAVESGEEVLHALGELKREIAH